MIWCSSGETRVITLCQTEHLERKPPGLALELRTVWRAGSLAGPQPGQPRRIPGATRNEKREPLGHTRLAELTRATAGETGTTGAYPWLVARLQEVSVMAASWEGHLRVRRVSSPGQWESGYQPPRARTAQCRARNSEGKIISSGARASLVLKIDVTL